MESGESVYVSGSPVWSISLKKASFNCTSSICETKMGLFLFHLRANQLLKQGMWKHVHHVRHSVVIPWQREERVKRKKMKLNLFYCFWLCSSLDSSEINPCSASCPVCWCDFTDVAWRTWAQFSTSIGRTSHSVENNAITTPLHLQPAFSLWLAFHFVFTPLTHTHTHTLLMPLTNTPHIQIDFLLVYLLQLKKKNLNWRACGCQLPVIVGGSDKYTRK